MDAQPMECLIALDVPIPPQLSDARRGVALRASRGGNVADDVAIAGTSDAMGLIGPRALWTEGRG